MKYLRMLSLFFVAALSLNTLASNVTPADFAKNAIYETAQLSPDGSKLAVALKVDGRSQLAVFDVETFKTIGGANLGEKNEVGPFFWANDERIVILVWQTRVRFEEPAYYGELFAVDYDGGNPEMIYGYRAGQDKVSSRVKKKTHVRGWADVISRLPDDDRNILISSRPWSEGGEKLATVHKLNIYNGRMTRDLETAPVSYTRFISDSKGNLRFATGTDKEGAQRTYRYVDEDWQEMSNELGSEFYPVALNHDNSALFFVDNYQQDRTGLFSLDLNTGERKSIYTDEKVDITSVSMSSDKTSAYAVRVDDGYPTYVMFNSKSEEAQIFKALLGTFQGYSLSILTRSRNGEKWLLYAANDIDMGTYYLYDRKANKLGALFSNFSHIPKQNMSESIPISFPASDGNTLHGYVTYPVGIPETENVPLVTLVHGGPHSVRDYWTFDPEVQMLAAQGYAVLRVNFRGSGGYGKDYMFQGYRQWGGLIQQDIIDATRYVISQGGIDGDKVCIMGTSFGGYSAVMSSALAPDLFKCAVANAGVYDMSLMDEKGDVPDLLFAEAMLEEFIGSDPEELETTSPTNHVSALQAPVFIAHGEEDQRAPLEHAEALRKAMDVHNKSYEWFVKDEEGHGFRNEKNRAEYFEAISDFLETHLE